MQGTKFTTMADVKRANKAAGQFWFSPDTMRFFRGRIESELVAGRWFVSSEQYDDESPRLYTVREVQPDASIETIGDFQGYRTKAAARKAIDKLAGA